MSKSPDNTTESSDDLARRVFNDMQKSEAEHRIELRAAIQAGAVQKIRELIIEYGSLFDDYAGDQAFLIDEMTTHPQAYKNKSNIMKAILDTPFDNESVFNELVLFTADHDKKIWTMYERDLNADTLSTAAAILAEYIRFLVRKGIPPAICSGIVEKNGTLLKICWRKN